MVVVGGAAMAAEPVLEIAPGQVRPGDALLVDLRVKGPCPVAWLGDRPLLFERHRRRCRAIAGVPVEQPPGELPIRIGSVGARAFLSASKVERRALAVSLVDAGSEMPRQPVPVPYAPDWPPVPQEGPVAGAVEVLPATFPERVLTVAPQFIEPPPAVQRRLREDRRAFAAAFAQAFRPAMFPKNFALPRESRVTAAFGDRRTFNGSQQSQHYGVDLDGSVGAPIRAANDGVVVMVRDNYAAGKTVVIHHGLDLYTTYFHLSRFEVRKGQTVKKGQRIGRVGKTGRVTGPHLHWGVKVGDLYVDPASVLRLDLER
jgi:Peptidase family M23